MDDRRAPGGSTAIASLWAPLWATASSTCEPERRKLGVRDLWDALRDEIPTS